MQDAPGDLARMTTESRGASETDPSTALPSLYRASLSTRTASARQIPSPEHASSTKQPGDSSACDAKSAHCAMLGEVIAAAVVSGVTDDDRDGDVGGVLGACVRTCVCVCVCVCDMKNLATLIENKDDEDIWHRHDRVKK